MAEPRGRAWMALGSNLGDRLASLSAARAALGRLPGTRIVAASSLHETPPWGDTDQPAFLNAALELDTTLAPAELMRSALAIEQSLGRVRTRRWGPRVIDLDIVAMEGVACATPDLTLPHPHATERAFVLAPLAEIAPDLLLAGRRVAEWLRNLDASGLVRLDCDW